MRYIQKALLLGGMLLTLGLGAVSCTKTKEFDLYNYQAATLQLRNFSIAAASDSTLKAHAFAIRNTADMGQVANVVPFFFGTELKDVKFTITPVNTSAKVTVSLDGQTFTDWTAETTYTFTADQDHLYVRIGLAGTEATYTYRVKFNVYKYDPHTITWQIGGAAPADILSRDSYGRVVPYGDGLLLVDGRDHVTGAPRYYRVRQSLATVSPTQYDVAEEVMLTGIPAGEYIRHVESSGTDLYALTSEDHVYQLSGTTWTALPIEVEVDGLLGVLPARTSDADPTLALLVRDAGGDRRFASYIAGKLTVSTAEVPGSFPMAEFIDDYYVSFATTERYVGSALRLIGERRSDVVSETGRSTWYTTNGLDWLNLYQEANREFNAVSISVVAVGDVLYRIETLSVGGCVIYMSRDHGTTWSRGSEVSLGGLDLSRMTSRSIATWSAEGTIYMLAGVNDAGDAPATLWAGIPRNNDY